MRTSPNISIINIIQDMYSPIHAIYPQYSDLERHMNVRTLQQWIVEDGDILQLRPFFSSNFEIHQKISIQVHVYGVVHYLCRKSWKRYHFKAATRDRAHSTEAISRPTTIFSPHKITHHNPKYHKLYRCCLHGF